MADTRKPGRCRRHIIWWRATLLGVLGLFLFGCITVIGAFVYAGRDLPSVAGLTDKPASSSTVYDVNNQVVASVGLHSTLPVSLNQVPKNFIRALIDTEDRTFYTNPGISFTGILRSVIANVHSGGFVEGASTITQQLVRDRYLTYAKTITRKLKEILLAVEVTRAYTKNEILTAYLNEVYLGAGAYGVGEAAHVYFGTSVSHLDLAQCAMLAGLPQAPSYLDPYVNFKAAKQRQAIVLQNMVAVGDITQKQADAAYKEPLHLQNNAISQSYLYPWFLDYVITSLRGHVSLQEIMNGGLRIYTTLDPRIETIAQNAVSGTMQHAFPSSAAVPEPQAAAVVMDPHNGYVLAIVGGRTHPVAFPLDRAIQPYQPGSTIKPLAEYPVAIQSGKFTEATILDDGPWLRVNGKFWPKNSTNTYYGRITLRRSLAISDNNNAVHLLDLVGVSAGFDMATKKFGLPLLPGDRNLAMGIGGLTRGVSVLQMADAYATYANGGIRPTPIVVRKVVAPDGQVLYQQSPHFTPELSPQISYIMINMMEHVLTDPGATAYGGGIGRVSAGKTGTSSQSRAGWFVGFTPQLVTAVWEGNDNNAPQPGVYGDTYAQPIWRQIMIQSLQNQPVENFPVPSGIAQVTVDTKSGQLPSPLTPPQYLRSYPFIAGTQPTQTSNVWQQVAVDAQHPKELWSPSCFPDQPLDKVLLTVPTDITSGAGIPHPLDSNLWVPTQYCGGGGTGIGAGTGAGAGAGQQQVALTIKGDQFLPSTLTVSTGASVALTVQNLDPVPHQFFLAQYMVTAVTVGPGTSQTIDFTTTVPGQWPFELVDLTTTGGTLTVQ